jgi:transposase
MTRTPHSHHSPEFKEQALLKARHRGTRSVISIAYELNMAASTLRKWLSASKQQNQPDSQPRCPLQLLPWMARHRPGRLHSV